MFDNAEIKQILIGAKSLIETHGWCQNAPVNEKGELCMLGAIRRSVRNNYSLNRIRLAVDKMQECVCNNRFNLVSEYNDAQGRTKDEVLTMFDKAIASLDKTE